jgi:hypothetical protein
LTQRSQQSIVSRSLREIRHAGQVQLAELDKVEPQIRAGKGTKKEIVDAALLIIAIARQTITNSLSLVDTVEASQQVSQQADELTEATQALLRDAGRELHQSFDAMARMAGTGGRKN